MSATVCAMYDCPGLAIILSFDIDFVRENLPAYGINFNVGRRSAASEPASSLVMSSSLAELLPVRLPTGLTADSLTTAWAAGGRAAFPPTTP